MAGTSLETVCRELGIDPVRSAIIAALPAADGKVITDAIVAEQLRRERDLAAAIDNGLRVIPRLVRPVAKKILFG